MKSRNKNIVMVSQFNIAGSRGKSVKPFITDYISRPDATKPSMAYIPEAGVIPKEGDGVAFTLDDTAIVRDEVLQIADRVEERFQQGDRAIQQVVLSFSPQYLVEQGVVPGDEIILHKGDYEKVYDDVRLRHAIRSGVQSLIDAEGYRDAKMVGCIQHDTLHLHAHLVVYEDSDELSRVRGREEKGVIKSSSMAELTHEIDRSLTLTKMPKQVVCEKTLEVSRPQGHEAPVATENQEEFDWMEFMDILRIRQEQEEAYQELMRSIQGHESLDI